MRILKNFRSTEKPAQKRYNFTHQDLEKAMVDGKVPKVLLRPFSDTPNKKLKNVKLSVLLVNTNNATPIDILNKSFNCDSNYIKNLSLWMLRHIWGEFQQAGKEWGNYIKENAEDFCKKSFIRSKWIIYSNSLKKNQEDIIDEQKLWILYNDMLDKEENIKLIESVRDSLIPWINPQLWKDVEKQKKSKHENVIYEKQKKAMVESNFEELDVVM